MLTEAVSNQFPQNVGVIVSLTFIVYILLSASFFTGLVRYFNGYLSSNLGPTVVAIVVLTISSLPIGLIPIDVFLVGQMKNATGIFQPWASDEHVRHHISTTVFCSYIVCYVVITLDIFVVIPAVYFFHKYGEFDRSRRSHSDMITAIGCSSLFLCGLMIVLAIGYFIPIEEISDLDADEEIQFRNLILELDTQKVEDVFAFVLAVVRIIGIALFSAYVAVGMAAGPISQLRGYVDPREKLQRVRSRRLGIEIEITEIQQNQHEGQSSAATLLDGIELASTEQIRLLELEREDLDLREELEQLQETTRHWIAQLTFFSRPLQIITGLLGVVVGLLIFTSLFMDNILRAMFSLGEPFGYLMPVVQVLNPLDRCFLMMESLFPLDFVFFVVLTGFIILSAVSGISRIGIGIPWIKVYHVVPLKTESHSLLAITMNLVVILLTLDTFMLAILPQYMTYGSQTYLSCADKPIEETYPLLPTPLPEEKSTPSYLQSNSNLCPDISSEVKPIPCDWNAPEHQCVMTRISVMWSRLSFKNWYCGALFYWISWIFLAVVVLEATFAMIRPTKPQQASIDGDTENTSSASDDS